MREAPSEERFHESQECAVPDVGRPGFPLYFRVPGNITYGQHWLNVKFEKSLVRVPFRILTDDEETLLSKNYGDISRQVKDAFKKKS